MKICYVRVEIVVHFNFVGVEFQFGRVKKSFGACKAWDHNVELFDKVQNVSKRSVGHRRRDISRNRVGQSGFNVGLTKLLFPGALSFQNIAVTLNENVSVRKHIRKLAYFFSRTRSVD